MSKEFDPLMPYFCTWTLVPERVEGATVYCEHYETNCGRSAHKLLRQKNANYCMYCGRPLPTWGK